VKLRKFGNWRYYCTSPLVYFFVLAFSCLLQHQPFGCQNHINSFWPMVKVISRREILQYRFLEEVYFAVTIRYHLIYLFQLIKTTARFRTMMRLQSMHHKQEMCMATSQSLLSIVQYLPWWVLVFFLTKCACHVYSRRK